MNDFKNPPAGKANSSQAVLSRIGFNRGKDILGPEPLCNRPDLEKAISSFLPMMKTPSREVKIAIVDNDKECVAPLAAFLNSWPNVLVHAIVQRAENVIEVPADTEILFLDHSMLGGVNGEVVAKNLRDGGFSGIIVSITGDGTEDPEYAQFKFLMKEMFRMGFAEDAAPGLVKVMNAALEKLDENDHAARLVSRMAVPRRTVRVTIVDDSPEESEGMVGILKRWPKIDLSVIMEGDVREIRVPKDTEILLLDEKMQTIRGAEIAARLKEEGFRGIIASTSKGKTPDYTELHFKGKLGLSEGMHEFAEEFVEFFNSVLKEAENSG